MNGEADLFHFEVPQNVAWVMGMIASWCWRIEVAQMMQVEQIEAI